MTRPAMWERAAAVEADAHTIALAVISGQHVLVPTSANATLVARRAEQLLGLRAGVLKVRRR